MKRKLQKMTAGILAALLIAGSVQIMPVGQVQAQGGYSETVSSGDEALDVDTAGGSNDDVSEPDGANAATAIVGGETAADGIMALDAEGRIVSGNILSEYNTSFEGVNDSGNLWWWNDASWSQAGIPRMAYGDSAKPSSDCGDYYVQVNATDSEKAQCQIAGDGIAALIKGGKTYEYSYYAKLAEGEPSGEVTFKVVGDWSNNATVTPDKEVTLSADEWQKVTGTFILSSDADSVMVRFEGSAGVSYCLDDLRVAEVVEQEKDRVITSNILSDYNTSFEGVNGDGNLYWWNDASWSQAGIPRKAYGDSAKPSSDCGDYYVQVNAAESAKAQCQIAGDKIAALIKGGKTYEYSYYAKLAEGEDSGEVTFNVLGDFSNSATVTPDKVVTLNADEWQKVTGTFTLSSDASDSVVVRFEGSAGVSYCLDDLRVGEVAGQSSDETEIVFTADQLVVEKMGDDITYELVGNKLQLTFYKQWDQVKLVLPESIDISKCVAVKFTVENQTQPVSFKLWKPDEAEADNVVYDKSGQSEYTMIPAGSGTFDKVGIMINRDYPDGAKITLVSVTFVMDYNKEIPEIQDDIPDLWREVIRELNDDDFIVGTAIAGNREFGDELIAELVKKHFNAVTLGNELKLDSMLGGLAATETVMFNGKELLVPKLNFNNADSRLDQILEWNEENPDNQIKVRGHVLVWHSQAPTAFFREGYNTSGAYVSKDVMDQRLEWYIKTMMEHYTGESSKYKDLFYGWDVVNEAINDGTGTYRSSGESDWAAVYGSQSNEYIIKAFRWANQYAPSTLELYYNDYNDSTPSKRDGIVKLLQAVKAADGTRISGMGMQGHYNLSSPSIAQFEAAARAYAAVVGKVQITEWDFTSSDDYDGTDATKDDEYTKQAYRYKDFYDAIKRLKADGVDFAGMTFWGVVDKYSWLHDQNNVGGGTDGKRPQCPLLFDDNYQAKPAFWAFVNPSELKPSIQKLTVIEDQGQGYKGAKEYSFGDGTVEVSFRPLWKNNTLKVQVTVKDATVDDNDSITLYIDEANSKSEYDAQQRAAATPQKVTINRKDAKTVSGGYQTEFSIPVSNITVAKKIGFDIRVANGDTLVSYNDYNNTQDTSSEYYAEAVFKPYALVGNGTAVVDGNKEAVWTEKGQEIPLTINLGSQVSATVTALWDEEYLYIFAEVKDAVLNNDSANEYEQDSLEVFIDENNHKSDAYEEDDKQYRISYTNYQSFNGEKCVKENVTSVAKVTADGYVIEAAYKWTDITPKAGMEIGLEFQINDANDTGKRIGTLSWYDETGMGWSSPGVYGTVKLVGEKEEDPKPSEPPSPAPSPNPTPSPELAPDSQGSAQNGSPVSPPTGDRSGIALITALLCLMGFALSAGKVYRLRKKIK